MELIIEIAAGIVLAWFVIANIEIFALLALVAAGVALVAVLIKYELLEIVLGIPVMLLVAWGIIVVIAKATPILFSALRHPVRAVRTIAKMFRPNWSAWKYKSPQRKASETIQMLDRAFSGDSVGPDATRTGVTPPPN